MENETDEQLMDRVVAGESEALELLYDQYASAVMGLTLKMLRDRQLAEEMVQETFWRVWDRADSFDATRGSFRSWMFSIAHRLAIDWIRRAKIRPSAARDEQEVRQMVQHTDAADNVPEQAWRTIQSERVRQALDNLPPEQYTIIEMAYFQGLTRREIAEQTDNPLGTVHTRARLALGKLRSFLQSEGLEA